MSSSFKSYLNEIARYPLLTVDQEIQYGRRIAAMRELRDIDRPLTPAEQRIIRSGLRARERFMQCNLQLVVHVAKKYENRKRKSLEIMDLVQEGNIGLARAVELFDYSRGYKFSTYAYWWIKQGIQRAISHSDAMIRLPTGLHDLLTKVARTTSDLGQQLGRMPSMQEVADNMAISLTAIHDAIHRSYAVCSLDAISANNDTASILDMIADAPPADDHVISEQAAEMMELMDMYLDERSAYVIRSRRLQKPMSWPELEAATGMTASQLQRLEKAGMFRLRMMLTKGKELHGTPLGGLG
jgi:RNA polymerase sigma factor (sigma-70 family)